MHHGSNACNSIEAVIFALETLGEVREIASAKPQSHALAISLMPRKWPEKGAPFGAAKSEN